LAGLKSGIKTVFSFGNIQRAAAECGFYRRSSKLLPDVFFDLLLKAAGTNGPISLSQLSSEAMSRHGISISKQAIDDRFDYKAVKFVKELLGQAIAAQMAPAADVAFLSKFNRVLVKDATRFDLPDRLKGDFAGFWGKVTSEAGMAIQYEYDLKNCRLHDLDFTSATRNDLRDAAETQEKACRVDLVLRDLGYFSSPVLAEFGKAGAYYLSRLKSKMEVLLDTGGTLSFSDLYGEMSRKGQYRKHLNVTIYHRRKKGVKGQAGRRNGARACLRGKDKEKGSREQKEGTDHEPRIQGPRTFQPFCDQRAGERPARRSRT
jgi:hypothetical protein